MRQRSVKVPVSGFSSEVELLLCCARTCMDTAVAYRLRDLLREDINWAYVIQTAKLHGMIPLLSRHLQHTCSEAVPQVILDQLQRYCHRHALHNLFLTRELLKLLALFEAHGISAIPYKGPVLAATVYGDLALRQFTDLDIVVHKQDVLSGKALLLSQGYRPLCQLSEAQEATLLQSFHAYAFVRDDGRVSVDLHWRFTPSHYAFPLELELLWEHLEPVRLADTMVLTLPPEDLLLILCVHGTKDGWTRLKWICDVAEMVRMHQGMDWDRVIEQSGKLRSEHHLFLGLLLASNLLGAALPQEVLRKVQTDAVAGRLAAQVHTCLFSETADVVKVVESSLLHFRVMQRWRDRITYVLHCLCTMMTPNTRDQALLSLPTALSCLHYIFRPIRLVGEYGLVLLQHLRGRPP